jgi:outer membrane protein, heavy metal efflux system
MRTIREHFISHEDGTSGGSVPVNHRGQGWFATLALAFTFALLSTTPRATAQDGIDVRSRFDTSPGGTLPGNRPGMSIGRGGPFRKDMLPAARPDQLTPPPVAGDVPPTHGVNLDLQDPEAPLGKAGGMTLPCAIEIMRRQNPDIIAARSEVDQARSDIVTAGLRSNPQFYADMQLVPYRVLAPGQADVNIAYPIDISGKRRTRVQSAACVLRSVEWRNRDFDRRQSDNLQTLFVDTLASQVTVDPEQLLQETVDSNDATVTKLKRKKAALEADAKKATTKAQARKIDSDLIETVSALSIAEDDLRDAQHGLDDAKSQYRDQLMALAQFLNVSDWRSIKLQGWLFDGRTYPDPEDEKETEREQASQILDGLTRLALESRPDLQSQRWNLLRALADVDAVRASRFDDVSFLFQPYTYGPTLPNRAAWAIGITIPLPIYNRQQGNLAKAQQIVAQTQAQLTSLESTVRAEVAAAYNAVVDTFDDMAHYNRLKSATFELPELHQTDPAIQSGPVRSYLLRLQPLARKLMNDTNNRHETLYYRALVDHRKSLLRINTACACIVCPDSPFSDSTSPLAPRFRP